MNKRIIFVATGHPDKPNQLYSNYIQSQIRILNTNDIDITSFPVDSTKSFHSIFRNINALRNLIKKVKPQIVHAHFGSIILLISFVASFRLCPIVVSYCGSDLINNSESSLLGKFRVFIGNSISRILSYYVNGIIVKSNYLNKFLPKNIQKNTLILPNPVDLDLFTNTDKYTARKNLGWDLEEQVILFNKGMKGSEYIKRPELAIEIFNRVKKRLSNIRLEIIGSIPPNKVPLYLAASDVLLLTSRYEGSPNLAKEAMAMNLPVVTVNVGDVQERLKTVSPGYVSESDSSIELENELINVLNFKARSNGREVLISQGLTFDNFINSLTDFYNNIINNTQHTNSYIVNCAIILSGAI